MAKKRASLGFGDALEDLGRFKPTPKIATTMGTSEAAEATGFKSREPQKKVVQRRRRTGRNAQFNIKAKPETIELFCAVADDNGWGLGETLEHAVDLLVKKYQ